VILFLKNAQSDIILIQHFMWKNKNGSSNRNEKWFSNQKWFLKPQNILETNIMKILIKF
jgi:hypothetical protein